MSRGKRPAAGLFVKPGKSSACGTLLWLYMSYKEKKDLRENLSVASPLKYLRMQSELKQQFFLFFSYIGMSQPVATLTVKNWLLFENICVACSYDCEVFGWHHFCIQRTVYLQMSWFFPPCSWIWRLQDWHASSALLWSILVQALSQLGLETRFCFCGSYVLAAFLWAEGIYWGLRYVLL